MNVVDSATGLSVKWSWKDRLQHTAAVERGAKSISASSAGGTANSPQCGRKSRLLVVDDERVVCELLSLFFEHQGIEVTTASTWAEGRARIENGEYDVAIVDWTLDGGLLGLDLVNLSHAKHPTAPVILFTGAEDSEGLERRLSGRVAAVMPKMGSLQALSAEVTRRLER